MPRGVYRHLLLPNSWETQTQVPQPPDLQQVSPPKLSWLNAYHPPRFSRTPRQDLFTQPKTLNHSKLPLMKPEELFKPRTRVIKEITIITHVLYFKRSTLPSYFVSLSKTLQNHDVYFNINFLKLFQVFFQTEL